jgi:hypothetical protein
MSLSSTDITNTSIKIFKMLSITINLFTSNILAIQNITIYESDVISDDANFDFTENLELLLLTLLIIAGAFFYRKVTKKYFNSQSPVQQLQNRMEVLETIIVNSVEISENITFDSNDGGGRLDIDCR